MIEIKQGVPIPPRNARSGSSEAIRNLKPGDYCAVPLRSENVRSLIAQMRKRGQLGELRYTLRKHGDKNTGVWCLTPNE